MSKGILMIHDLSNYFFSSVHEYCSRENATDIDINLLRGMILTRINAHNKQLSKGRKFTTVVAIDTRDGYWRKDIFSLYKYSRKKDREESKVDWDSIFEKWNIVVKEYKENIPYIFIDVSGAEGDDIHASLCFKLHDEFDEIINCSSDEDIAQLMKFAPNIKQYSLKRKRMINIESVKYDLFEHIIKGDAGDGIPNILSSADHFTKDGVRQTPVQTKKMNEWKLNGGIRNPEVFCDAEMLERFKLNKKLVDFDEIPEEIIDEIYQVYLDYKLPKQKCFNYFIKHQLLRLIEEFKS